jgi:hypothetical protein
VGKASTQDLGWSLCLTGLLIIHHPLPQSACSPLKRVSPIIRFNLVTDQNQDKIKRIISYGSPSYSLAEGWNVHSHSEGGWQTRRSTHGKARYLVRRWDPQRCARSTCSWSSFVSLPAGRRPSAGPPQEIPTASNVKLLVQLLLDAQPNHDQNFSGCRVDQASITWNTTATARR